MDSLEAPRLDSCLWRVFCCCFGCSRVIGSGGEAMYLLTLWMLLVVVILEAPLSPPWRKILGITLIVVTVLVLLGFTGIFGANPYFRVR